MNHKKWLFPTLLAIAVAVGGITHPFNVSQVNAQSAVGKEELVTIASPDYPPYEFYKDGPFPTCHKIDGCDRLGIYTCQSCQRDALVNPSELLVTRWD